MRILHLTQFYAPVIGGEERHVTSLSQGLAARGHDVVIAALSHRDRPPVVMEGDVTVRSVDGTLQRFGSVFSDDERRHAPPFPDPGITLGLAKIVEEFRPDVVHGHNWMVHSFLPLKRSAGPRLVMTLHDYGLTCARKTMMRNGSVCEGPSMSRCMPCAVGHYGALVGPVTCAGNWASGLFERRAVDRFVAVSDAVASMCGLQGGRVPYDVLPTFIPDDVASLSEPGPLVSHLPAGDFVLYVGDLNRNKGVGVLLDAYAMLPDMPPLVLIGRLCADMPAKLPPNVRMFERWPHASVMHAWSRCLFGVAPSVWPEACGTIVMEANAVGRPMVASATGGLADLVEDGVTGLLVPPGDAGALAGAISTLVLDAPRRERMAAAAKARAESFMAKAIVPRLERVYEDALRATSQRMPVSVAEVRP